jgi:hypothetical protein
MFIDSSLVFDQGAYSTTNGMTGVAAFASAGTTYSTNVLDMQQARDMGQSPEGPAPLTVTIIITAAFTGGTSVNFQLQGSTDNTTYTTYAETGVILIALLTANAKIKIPLPQRVPDSGSVPRYYRLAYVNAGAMAAGSVISYLGITDFQTYYAPGVTVSN